VARDDYHDPTAGIAGAPPALSALDLAADPAIFGMLSCGAVAALLLITASQPVIAAIFAFFAAVALVDMRVIARRKLRGEPGLSPAGIS
jgi:hypothetical protein